jgi:hypothetical protein
VCVWCYPYASQRKLGRVLQSEISGMSDAELEQCFQMEVTRTFLEKRLSHLQSVDVKQLEAELYQTSASFRQSVLGGSTNSV